jgi:hypothetical protein
MPAAFGAAGLQQQGRRSVGLGALINQSMTGMNTELQTYAWGLRSRSRYSFFPRALCPAPRHMDHIYGVRQATMYRSRKFDGIGHSGAVPLCRHVSTLRNWFNHFGYPHESRSRTTVRKKTLFPQASLPTTATFGPWPRPTPRQGKQPLTVLYRQRLLPDPARPSGAGAAPLLVRLIDSTAASVFFSSLIFFFTLAHFFSLRFFFFSSRPTSPAISRPQYRTLTYYPLTSHTARVFYMSRFPGTRLVLLSFEATF